MAERGIVMVLGSPNSTSGSLYSVARARCEQAMALWRDNPGWRILLTGGYGEHLNTTTKPHAEYLRDYLVGQGVPAESILEFAESRNSIEDAALTRPIVESHDARVVAIVTSDYHMARARFLFNREFAGTSVSLLFVGVPTDEEQCESNLARQIEHERKALKSLKEGQEAQQEPGAVADVPCSTG